MHYKHPPWEWCGWGQPLSLHLDLAQLSEEPPLQTLPHCLCQSSGTSDTERGGKGLPQRSHELIPLLSRNHTLALGKVQ